MEIALNENAGAKSAVKRLAKLAYPKYKGRKFYLEVRSKYMMENYWDGGSRSFVKAVNLATGEVRDPAPASTNVYDPRAHGEIGIPAGIALVEHAYFCGKDCGIRVVVSGPAELAAWSEDKALEAVK